MEYVNEFVNGAKSVFVRIEFLGAVRTACRALGINLCVGAASDDCTMMVLYVD